MTTTNLLSYLPPLDITLNMIDRNKYMKMYLFNICKNINHGFIHAFRGMYMHGLYPTYC